MTIFWLVCACEQVREWLEELGKVKMDRARIQSLARQQERE